MNIPNMNSANMNTENITNDQVTNNQVTKNQATNGSSKDKQPAHLRFVNTFMKRRTHMNKMAEQALTDPSFAHYLVNGQDGDITGITNLRQLFTDTHNTADSPLTLEIGFGMGDSLVKMAEQNRQHNFVGIEVHEPGIGKCAYMAGELGLDNLKIINGDAIKLMQQLPDEHIDHIQLYFPDPWQKKRHHKRRFVSPERIPIVHRVLKTGGWFHTATDWQDYAEWILNVLDNFDGFSNTAGVGNATPRPAFRPMTKFEKRGIERGHGIWDFIFSKTA